LILGCAACADIAWIIRKLKPSSGQIHTIGALPPFVILICMTVVALVQTSVERMQRWMWLTIKVSLVMRLPLSVILGILSWADGGKPGELFCVPPLLFALYVACSPSLHRRAHGCLRRQYDTRKKMRAATGVAALLGGLSMPEILSQARARFRCIDLSEVHEADIADNRPNAALFLKSRATALGACDAFISHSWHDDPGLKWKALQSWRAKFVAQHGREPLVWIDKCCLDQTNLDLDVRCLPIFMSGCNQLVVLFGPTYLKRLWCVVELFTFVQMELDFGSIDLEHLWPHGSCRTEDRAAFACTMDAFCVSKCECFSTGDKQKLQNVIYAGFGDMRNFNREVLRALRGTGMCTTV